MSISVECLSKLVYSLFCVYQCLVFIKTCVLSLIVFSVDHYSCTHFNSSYRSESVHRTLFRSILFVCECTDLFVLLTSIVFLKRVFLEPVGMFFRQRNVFSLFFRSRVLPIRGGTRETTTCAMDVYL